MSNEDGERLVYQGIIVLILGYVLLGFGIGWFGIILGPYWILKGISGSDSIKGVTNIIGGIISWIIIIFLWIEFSWFKWVFLSLIGVGITVGVVDYKKKNKDNRRPKMDYNSTIRFNADRELGIRTWNLNNKDIISELPHYLAEYQFHRARIYYDNNGKSVNTHKFVGLTFTSIDYYDKNGNVIQSPNSFLDLPYDIINPLRNRMIRKAFEKYIEVYLDLKTAPDQKKIIFRWINNPGKGFVKAAMIEKNYNKSWEGFCKWFIDELTNTSFYMINPSSNVKNHGKLHKYILPFSDFFDLDQLITLRNPSEIIKDRKSTRLNSSHTDISRMPSSA